jgi:hypothetical protein
LRQKLNSDLSPKCKKRSMILREVKSVRREQLC